LNAKDRHGVLTFFMFFNADGSTIPLNYNGFAEFKRKIASWERGKGYCQAAASVRKRPRMQMITADRGEAT